MSRPSVDELVAAALAEPPSSLEHWEQVHALRKRGGQDVFEAAAALCRSPYPQRRALGISVLAQIGPWGDPDDPETDQMPWYMDADSRRWEPHARIDALGKSPHGPEAADLLVELLEEEREIEVLESLFIGLGHLDEPRCIGPAVEMLAHPDPKLRSTVAFSLLSHEDDRAVDALIELSADEDADVRGWATFGLARQLELDTPALRAALLARLDDPDPDTQIWAMVGLGRCGEPRVTAPLLAKREKSRGDRLDEALWLLAATTGDPALREEVELSAAEFRETHPGKAPPYDLREALARLGLMEGE